MTNFPVRHKENDTLLEWSPLLESGLAAPTGVIFPYAANTAPTGYLLCDGTAVSRTTYASLFTLISTTYGTGDGATTFNLPDLRQRFPLGKAASGTGATLGSTGGAIDHTHSVPAHYHSTTATGADIANSTAPAHEHFMMHNSTGSSALSSSNYVAAARNAGNDFSYGADNGATSSAANVGRTSADNAHTHTLSGRVGLVTGGSNGDSAMTSGATNPPFLSLNFIIKY